MKQASKGVAMVVGVSGDYESVRTVHSPEELAGLCGWSVQSCRELCAGPLVPVFILPTETTQEPAPPAARGLREKIQNTVSDCAANFVYYDRKEDEHLSTDDLEAAIEDEVVTLDEIAQWFRDGLGYVEE